MNGMSKELIFLKDHIDEKHLAVMNAIGKMRVDQAVQAERQAALPCKEHAEALDKHRDRIDRKPSREDLAAVKKVACAAVNWNRALAVIAAALAGLLGFIGIKAKTG